MEDFEGAVERLRVGRATYNEFVSETRPRWEALAGWLLGRWKLPGWVERDDILQDLLVGAWRACWTYEEGRGSMPLGRYVRYAAVGHAQKRIHKMRGVSLHTCVGPSRVDMPMASLSEEAQRILEALQAMPASQEDELIDRQGTQRAMARCQTIEELLVVQALALTRGLEESAALLHADEDARSLLGLRSEEHAVQVVVRTACAFAQRVQQAA